jgi:ArsR family transcriptional regulator
VTSAITRVLKALTNPNRRRVFQLICRHGSRREGVTIERIRRAAGMKQPAVSHHVARLAEAGLILRRKTGWYVCCAPAPEGLAALRRFSRNPAAFPLK